MGFISINDGFVCERCGHENGPAVKTCRNHCTECLYSKHVDSEFPGDRNSECMGEMIPTEIIPHPKHSLVIIHQCRKCQKQIHNKIADDDNKDTIYSIMQKVSEERI